MGRGADFYYCKIAVQDDALEWGLVLSATGNTVLSGAAVADDGTSYVAGFFQDDLQTTNGLVSAQGNDMFVGRVSAGGTLDWLLAFGGTGIDRAADVALTTSQQAIVMVGSSANDHAHSVDYMPDGSLIVAGEHGAGMAIAGTTLSGAGGSDAFVARLLP